MPKLSIKQSQPPAMPNVRSSSGRWSYGCTLYELSVKGLYLMGPFQKQNADISAAVRCWCKHHADVKGRVCTGDAREVQKRVFALRQPVLRRIVWQCCHPVPRLRASRLDSELELWHVEKKHSAAKHAQAAREKLEQAETLV